MGKSPANMRVTLALLCIATVAFGAPLGNNEITKAFTQFKADFNKVYSELQEHVRFDMFTKNVNHINNFNQNEAATAGYTMAINQFTDWTPEEFSAYLTYDGSKKAFTNVVLLDHKGRSHTSQEPRTMWLMLGLLHHRIHRGRTRHRSWSRSQLAGLPLRARARRLRWIIRQPGLQWRSHGRWLQVPRGQGRRT